MTDDVIHSTQYYIMCINWAILANLQRRTLKLGRLIVLQETHLRLQKFLLPWQLTLFQSPPTWFQYVSDFQLQKRYTRPQTQEKHIYMLVGSCISGTICKYENWTPRVARNVFNIGEVWNPVCCHGNTIVKLKLWSTFSRILLLRIKHFWYKLAEISFFIIFDQNLVEYMTSSLG